MVLFSNSEGLTAANSSHLSATLSKMVDMITSFVPGPSLVPKESDPDDFLHYNYSINDINRPVKPSVVPSRPFPMRSRIRSTSATVYSGLPEIRNQTKRVNSTDSKTLQKSRAIKSIFGNELTRSTVLSTPSLPKVNVSNYLWPSSSSSHRNSNGAEESIIDDFQTDETENTSPKPTVSLLNDESTSKLTSVTETEPAVLCCDKCDGKHKTDDCPYYKKDRETHPDAQKGSKHLGGTSLLPGAWLRTARVVRQPGDGSCLFHSMCYGLGESSASHLRQEICSFIQKNPNFKISDTALSDWVKWDSGVSCREYACRMSRGAWGGGIEMACVAYMKGVNVHVYERCDSRSKGAGGMYKRISAFDHPVRPEQRLTIRVLYCGGVHYDALEAEV